MPTMALKRKGRIIIYTLGILGILLLTLSAGFGHEWYPPDCCSGKDCKPISCRELVESSPNMIWYYDLAFQGGQIRKSLDEHCHVCIAEAKNLLNEIIRYPRCVFRIVPNS